METELLKEVAGLAAGFSELEEQNNAKVNSLIKKEDEIVSLQIEVCLSFDSFLISDLSTYKLFYTETKT